MKYLIDTNIIVDHLRIGEKKATEFLKKVERGEVKASISVITEYELLVSQKISPSQKLLIRKLLSLLPSISLTSSIAREAVKFAQKYQLGMADSLIAGTAFKTNSILVTRDKIFLRIKEIKIETLKWITDKFEKLPTNNQSTVNFLNLPYSRKVGEKIEFSATTSNFVTNTLIFNWNFGAGLTTTTNSPFATHA